MAKEENRGHVVVLPYPSQGHINPLLQFAKRLAFRGVKSTLATTPYTIHSIRATNVEIEPISDGFDEGGFAQAKNEELYLKSFKANGSKTLSLLIQKLHHAGSPVTCVVYDSFLPWALDVAKQHDILGASFFTNSAVVCSIYCRAYHGLITVPVKPEDTPMSIPGLPPLSDHDFPSFVKSPGCNTAYFELKMGQYSNLEKADWVFANSFEELEGKETAAITKLWPGTLIGPMIPSAYLDCQMEGDKGYGASLWKPLSQECEAWLETKPARSVVYLSFGTMLALKAKQMEEIGLGLKETNLDFLLVLQDAERAMPSWFMDSIKEKGLIVPWCNQLEVLSHQAIGCFVTHCGWNSTLEGLSLGVPMVCMPQWTDQTTNAKYIEEIWQVGVRTKVDEKGIVGKEEFVKCLKQVMDGKKSQEINKSATKWKQLAKEAISEGGSSDNSINRFVECLVNGNRK